MLTVPNTTPHHTSQHQQPTQPLASVGSTQAGPRYYNEPMYLNWKYQMSRILGSLSVKNNFKLLIILSPPSWGHCQFSSASQLSHANVEQSPVTAGPSPACRMWTIILQINHSLHFFNSHLQIRTAEQHHTTYSGTQANLFLVASPAITNHITIKLLTFGTPWYHPPSMSSQSACHAK